MPNGSEFAVRNKIEQGKLEPSQKYPIKPY